IRTEREMAEIRAVLERHQRSGRYATSTLDGNIDRKGAGTGLSELGLAKVLPAVDRRARHRDAHSVAPRRRRRRDDDRERVGKSAERHERADNEQREPTPVQSHGHPANASVSATSAGA